MMSSPFNSWPIDPIFLALRLLVIVVAALIVHRLLRGFSNSLVKPAASQTRGAQAHERQTRAVADAIYSAGRLVIWGATVLTVLPQLGISAWPAVTLAAVALLAVSIGARDAVRDVISGCHILLEDQFATGETIRVGDLVGRVENVSLRRTLLRDSRGAIVTLANGDIRQVGNMSRDYSQAFVDVSVAVEEAMDRVQQALEAASAGIRVDPAWSQALVEGPRVLGIQEFGPAGCTLRLQVRTAPTRQDDVCRELRRRIQIEFQRQGIALSNVQSIDQSTAFHALADIEKAEPAS